MYEVTKYASQQPFIFLGNAFKGMMSNRRLSRHIADMGFHEFRRQLMYKAALKGNTITVADRWYPSSKRCSSCGEIKEDLELGTRVYTCEQCDNSCDRDENAARNLLGLLGNKKVVRRVPPDVKLAERKALA